MIKAIRSKTRDVAYVYRMGSGVPGGVNRSHPATIVPEQSNSTYPVAGFGFPVLADSSTGTVRGFIASDASSTAVAAWGVSVRPFPFQTDTATGYGATALGAGVPPAGVQDTLRAGYIMSAVVGTPTKGGTVYVWCAASTGSHVQGGLEAAASSGNTVPLSNAVFNGGADASGVAEISFNV